MVETVKFFVKDGKVDVEYGDEKEETSKEGKKLTLKLCLMDENSNVFVEKKANATWTLTDDDSLFDKEYTRETISELFKDQLIIDLNKGLMRSLIDKFFEKRKGNI
jgi:hypothetical protein